MMKGNCTNCGKYGKISQFGFLCDKCTRKSVKNSKQVYVDQFKIDPMLKKAIRELGNDYGDYWDHMGGSK